MLPFVAYFETLDIIIIIAFVPVHVYTLKFGGKNDLLSFFKKKCPFSIFLHNIIEAQFSLKKCMVTPNFLFGFQ